MADRSALGRLGWAFGAVTAAVMLMAAVVVMTHLDGGRDDAGARPFAAAAVSMGAR